ncbi:hypothetical protein GLOIN_2v1677213 [Rhizophagus irregularis DAOM 181602=DAOM 197198]|uniref:Uncharacterized protein n=1 Tax=Rhizophagus irregularis (strain DAOM 181602 / DAOM 197198 / MUCL 43194) TaxID=747089 RepID=A0A2P4PFV7_RHIID|nr:hypothetical protein GLOIN_2v1677213 [Rhizophagus irregularis DAOM 181602=DAOM 197198]POG64237.1 hypothetical protein GLOIN_2v1677213 [Rhizophagus irregularis DAOM 181602=DAOM 197198]GET65394.1 hypothetical protein GLOIN_2v1677213 [Rhizophagus irregularis DAOM 181602=DAOM 197198]GET65398.1 hypothetical protein GLOIN_2v1677213 [Rhizophagus irregularis DAOM 181602=DAOM 197198]|eukprot:XP_025171103.1 hypothetical protein GLOIN_2v1677213 [Rhizophagus irregularis DAOM 181602=DAOM 197198]
MLLNKYLYAIFSCIFIIVLILFPTLLPNLFFTKAAVIFYVPIYAQYLIIVLFWNTTDYLETNKMMILIGQINLNLPFGIISLITYYNCRFV